MPITPEDVTWVHERPEPPGSVVLEKDGWRLSFVEDVVAIDNGPAVKQAREAGESEPPMYHAVIPNDIIRVAAGHLP